MLPNVKAPKFIKDPHFYIDNDGFHLRDGAPPEVVQEFEEFMKYYKDMEEEGIAI